MKPKTPDSRFPGPGLPETDRQTVRGGPPGFHLARWIFALLLAALMFPASAGAQQITLTAFPHYLIPETDTLEIRWAENVTAWLEYGSEHGRYPRRTSAAGRKILRFVPRQEGMTAGIYFCRISSGSLHSPEFSVIIESQQAPVMRSPQNGAVIATPAPRFQWNAVPGVPFYHLILSDQPVRLTRDASGNLVLQGANIIYQAITDQTEITYGSPDPSGSFNGLNGTVPPLLDGKTYNWIVLNNYGDTPALTSIVQSGVQSFTVQIPGALPAPALLSPASGVSLHDAEYTFSWQAVSGAASYQFELFEQIQEESSTSTYPVWQAVTTEAALQVPLRQICKNGYYEWHVIALDGTGKGTASVKRNFTYQVPSGELVIVTRTEDGSALPRADVRVEPEQGSGENNQYLTSDYGWITLNVQPGTYRVTAHKSGFRDSTVTAEVEVNGSTQVLFYLVPLRRSVSGLVSDGAGHPVAAAGIVARDLISGNTLRALTDEAGAFRLLLDASVYRLNAQKDGYFAGDSVQVDLRSEREVSLSAPLRLEKASGVVSGRVVSSAGNPLFGARITACQGSRKSEILSDEQGSFQIKLSPGSWEIRAGKPGYSSTAVRTVAVPDGGSVQLSPDLVLQANAAIFGGLVTDGARGVPGVKITAQSADGTIFSGAANGKGSFSLSLPPGTYSVLFRHPGYLPAGPFQVGLAAGESLADFVVRMQKAPVKITGTVQAENMPVAGAVVRAGGYRDTTNFLGAFQLSVAEGTYLLAAEKAGFYIPAPLEVTAVAGHPVSDVVLTLERNGAVLEGTVRAGTAAVPQAWVWAVKSGDSLATESAGDGSYRLFLAPGVWRIGAQKEGYRSAAVQDIALNAGQTISGLDLSLVPEFATVQGTVTGPSGKGIARAVVSAPERGQSALTDSQGRYRLRLGPGAVLLRALAKGYAGAEKSLNLTAGGTVTADFKLTKTAVLRVSVRQPDGTPVNRAEILAVQNGDTLRALSDYAGEAVFYLQGGAVTLRADKLGFSAAEENVSLQAGRQTSAVLTLQPNPAEIAEIRGRVSLDRKRDLSGVLLQLSGRQTRQTQTDVQGFFSFEKLEAGYPYVLRPRRSGLFFVPPERRYNPLSGNQTGQDFVASYYGDISGNQAVSAFDGSIVLRISARKDVSPYFTHFPRDSLAADVSGNGRVSSFDASLIFRYAVGLIGKFPAEEKVEARPARPQPAPERPLLKLATRWRGEKVLQVALLLQGAVPFFSLDARLRVPGGFRLRSGVHLGTRLAGLQTAWSLRDSLLFLAAAGTKAVEPGDTLFWTEFVPSGTQKRGALAGFRLEQLLLDEREALREPLSPALPRRFRLSAPFPNPFHSEVHFEVAVPETGSRKGGRLRVEVFNLLGQRVAVLARGPAAPGVHRLSWDGTSSAGRLLPSGIYLLRARFGGKKTVKKLLLVR